MQHDYFITLYAGYSSFSIGLFNTNRLIDQLTEQKTKASSLMVPCIKLILERNTLTLDALTFIGVCNGPGPFTSLRISVVTANSLAYACSKPVVAINSFDALSLTTFNEPTLMLYNAYGGDFYYRLVVNNLWYDGCATIKDLSALLLSKLIDGQSIYCMGQGVSLALSALRSQLSSYSFIQIDSLQEPTVQALGEVAYKNYSKGLSSKSVEPLYLKIGYNL